MNTKISERNIEDYLRNKCKQNDILIYKFTSQSNSGVPDDICIKNGNIVFCEIKAPGQKPRKLQLQQIAKIKKHGAKVYVIDSYEQVDELIEYLNNTINITKPKKINSEEIYDANLY